MNSDYIRLSVYGILEDSQDRILMHKRANTSFGNNFWSLPGGHIEKGESTYDALYRELSEEVGVQIERDQSRLCLTWVRKPENDFRYINFFYIISKWKGTPIISNQKASEIDFVLRDELPDPTLQYIQEALSLISHGTHFYESGN